MWFYSHILHILKYKTHKISSKWCDGKVCTSLYQHLQRKSIYNKCKILAFNIFIVFVAFLSFWRHYVYILKNKDKLVTVDWPVRHWLNIQRLTWLTNPNKVLNKACLSNITKVSSQIKRSLTLRCNCMWALIMFIKIEAG